MGCGEPGDHGSPDQEDQMTEMTHTPRLHPLRRGRRHRRQRAGQHHARILLGQRGEGDADRAAGRAYDRPRAIPTTTDRSHPLATLGIDSEQPGDPTTTSSLQRDVDGENLQIVGSGEPVRFRLARPLLVQPARPWSAS